MEFQNFQNTSTFTNHNACGYEYPSYLFYILCNFHIDIKIDLY